MREWTKDLNIPADVEAEKAFLATCCSPGADLEAKNELIRLDEADFHHPSNRALFVAARTLVSRGHEINALTLKDVMLELGTLASVGGYPGLVGILAADDVADPGLLGRILRRKRQLRDLIKQSGQQARKAASEVVDPDVIVGDGIKGLMEISQGSSGVKGLRHAGEIALDQVVPGVLRRIESPDAYNGVRTHLTRLDDMTKGFQPGNLIVVAARPGIGKTALALNWLLRSNEFYGTNGGFFSLEMSDEEIVMRLMAIQSRFHPKNVGFGRGTIESDMARVRGAAEWLESRGLYVNDNASITAQGVRAMLEQKQASLPSDKQLKWAMVDYLQLMSSADGDSKFKNEATRIGEISRTLKLTAKDLAIPIVVMSQLNRELEHRQGGRPQLSDLRDSGAIEQDADMVIFIHGKTVPGPDGVVDPSRELIVAKHRNGPTGLIPLRYEGESFSFFELVRETGGYEPPPNGGGGSIMEDAEDFDLSRMGLQ
jgi:replicative DNA helicase